MFDINIRILDVNTQISTDQNLSFDAMDSIISRAVQGTLQAYLSLPTEDRLAAYKVHQYQDEDEEEEEDD
jgi:hypothetical protein